MSLRNPAYKKQSPSAMDPMKSMSHEQPMQSLSHPKGEAGEEEVDMDIAPLLHSEMNKVHGRTRCQTCAIITQTVLLTCIGLVIIAGVLVINWRFAILNEELASIAYTGELARPLLNDAGQLTQNFNNFTGILGGDLGKKKKTLRGERERDHHARVHTSEATLRNKIVFPQKRVAHPHRLSNYTIIIITTTRSKSAQLISHFLSHFFFYRNYRKRFVGFRGERFHFYNSRRGKAAARWFDIDYIRCGTKQKLRQCVLSDNP